MGKNCGQCGASLADGSAFCNSCGAQQTQASTPKNKKDGFKTGFFVLLILCAVCIVVLLCVLLMPDTDRNSGNSGTGETGNTIAATAPGTEPTQPPVTEPPVTEPEETEPPATEPPATEPPSQPSDTRTGLYLINVTDANYPIYRGPGIGYDYVGTVETAGYYTIMEEVRDTKGKLWGRLKSGAGWITVDGFEKKYVSGAKLSADYATREDFQNPNGYQCGNDSAEYVSACAFYISEMVTEVHVCETEFTGYGYEPAYELGSWYSWSPDTPLILWGSFPGDMSAYYICFTDSVGAVHQYCVSISGMDGSLVLTDFYRS